MKEKAAFRSAFFKACVLICFVLLCAFAHANDNGKTNTQMAAVNNEMPSTTKLSEALYLLGDICGSGESFDNVTPPKLPVGWTAINAIDPDEIFWQTSASGDPTPPANSPPNAAWVNDPDAISDKYLEWSAGTIDPNTEFADLGFHTQLRSRRHV